MRTEKVISTGVSIIYALLLSILFDLPFPINYLYTYTGLIIVMIFVCCLLRLRAKVVLILMIFYVMLSALVFHFVNTGTYSYNIRNFDTSYYWAATFHLVTVSMVGYAVSVGLERTARRREKPLFCHHGCWLVGSKFKTERPLRPYVPTKRRVGKGRSSSYG